MDYLHREENWIPKLGFGTFNLTGREAQGALEFALDCGYRHFDTAQMYENESEIGAVLGSSTVARERLFITTKVWGTNLSQDRFMPSVEKSLKDLKQDYVNLLLIHWPNADIPLEESLHQLQEAREKGYCKLIGVSNFTVELLEKVQALKVDIACNQFEYHPFLNQDKLLAKTKELGCFATAYSPLARGMVIEEPIIEEIARYKRKTAVQVALRWLVQQDEVVAIPKSAKIMRIKQNFDVFTFSLSDEEMSRIGELTSRNKRLINPEFAPKWD